MCGMRAARHGNPDPDTPKDGHEMKKNGDLIHFNPLTQIARGQKSGPRIIPK